MGFIEVEVGGERKQSSGVASLEVPLLHLSILWVEFWAHECYFP
jgi:hypothetical protein